MTTLEISVIDINEQPQCTIIDNNGNTLTLNVDDTVGVSVLMLQCTDPDVSALNKRLTPVLSFNPQISGMYPLCISKIWTTSEPVTYFHLKPSLQLFKQI